MARSVCDSCVSCVMHGMRSDIVLSRYLDASMKKQIILLILVTVLEGKNLESIRHILNTILRFCN